MVVWIPTPTSIDNTTQKADPGRLKIPEERERIMRYFINNELCIPQVYSLDDLKKEFYKLTFEDRDGKKFGEWLECCQDYNNGSLTEIPSKPKFETEAGEIFGHRIERSWDDYEIGLIRRMINDDFYEMIQEDYMLLESLIELKLYKLERGIEE